MSQTNKPTKGNHPPLQVDAQSDANAFINSQITDEQVKADVMDFYSEMRRGQPYAQIYNDLFRFNKISLFFFHCFSLILATPFIFSTIAQYIFKLPKSELSDLINGNAEFTKPYMFTLLVTLVILALMEVGQSKTLKNACKIYFLDGNKITGSLFIGAAIFSLFSIASSTLGGNETIVLKTHNRDNAAVAKWDKDIQATLNSIAATSGKDRLDKLDARLEYQYMKRDQLEAKQGSSKQIKSYMTMLMALLFEFLIIRGIIEVYRYKHKSLKGIKIKNDATAAAAPPTQPQQQPKTYKPVNGVKVAPNGALTTNQYAMQPIGFKQAKTGLNETVAEKGATAGNLVSTEVATGNADLTKLKDYLRTYRHKLREASPQTKRSKADKVDYLKYLIVNFDTLKDSNGKVYMDIANATNFINS